MRNKETTAETEENFTYMLRCADGSLYTGWTNNLEKRVRTHESGKGGKYTSSHRPVQLAYFEVFSEKKEAQSREVKIKRLPKAEKEALIQTLSDERRAEIREINNQMDQ